MIVRLIAALGAVLGLAAAGGAWAQSPPAPSDHWDLRRAGESCYLTRSFANGPDSLELRIQSFGSDTPYHFALIGNGLPIRKDRAILAHVGFGGEAAAEDMIALAGASGKLPEIVLAISQSHQTNMLGWYYSYIKTDAKLVGSFDSQAEELYVDFADTPPIRLALGPMQAEYTRLDDCAREIVGELRAANSPGGYPALPPRMLEVPTVNRRVKYPDNLILNRISGLVEMRMTVDETGKVKGCVPQITVWVAQFGSDACHEMERWARVEPAHDDHDKPVSTMYRTAAMYVIYNW